MKGMRQFQAYALVIEDSPVDAMALEEALKSMGCTVDVCDDVSFQEKMENHYDIIFVDINMPIMDGFLLSYNIRRSSLPTKHTPIIAVSCDRYSKEKVDKCTSLGLDGYVEKPMTLRVLMEALVQFVPEKEVSSKTFDKDDEARPKGFFRKRKE